MNPVFLIKISSLLSYPPYSLFYLAASLDKDKIPYRIFFIKPEQTSILLKSIRNEKPALLCFSLVTDHSISFTYSLINKIKSLYPKLPVLCGGTHISLFQELIFNDMPFDYGCIGFGEEFINKFYQCFCDKISLDENLTIFKRSDTKCLFTNYQLNDIDNYVFADKIIDNFKYNNISSFPLITSRGCPYDCGFCYCPAVYKRNWLPHSIEWVKDLFDRINHKFSPKSVDFCDDHFFVNFERGKNIIELINKPWSAEIRAELVDNNFAQFVSKTKCKKIFIGVESASSETLNKINKNLSIEQIENAISILSKYRINTDLSFIIGFPFETDKTIDLTINFIKNLFSKYKYVNASIKLYTPYPNTHLWNDSVNAGFKIPVKRNDYISMTRFGVILPWLSEKYRLIAFSSQYAFSRMTELQRRFHKIYSPIAKLRFRYDFFSLPAELFLLKVAVKISSL
ncbi:MAG: radical SAM protein [Candidatus Hydrogenedentota bacterium]